MFDHERGEHVTVGDARIYVETAGLATGPVMLCLHGGMGHIEDWNPALARLADRYRMVGVDARAHGKSTLGSADLSYARLAEDINAVLAERGIEHVACAIGFSDGGIVALRLAADQPARFGRLVVVGTEWHPRNVAQLGPMFGAMTAERVRTKFPDIYATYQRLNPEPNFETFVRQLSAMWLDTSERGYPGDRVERITCPVLVARGDDDHLTLREEACALAAKLRAARLLSVPFAGHVLHGDQPEIFATVLDHFLADAR